MSKKKEVSPTKNHSCLPAVAWTLGIIGTLSLMIYTCSSPIAKPGMCYRFDRNNDLAKLTKIDEFGPEALVYHVSNIEAARVDLSNAKVVKCDEFEMLQKEDSLNKTVAKLEDRLARLEIDTWDIRAERCQKEFNSCVKLHENDYLCKVYRSKCRGEK